jgi:hypothetical protein
LWFESEDALGSSINASGNPSTVAVSPDGRKAYVTNEARHLGRWQQCHGHAFALTVQSRDATGDFMRTPDLDARPQTGYGWKRKGSSHAAR